MARRGTAVLYTCASHAKIMETVRGYCVPVAGFHGHQKGSSLSGGAPWKRACTPLLASLGLVRVKVGFTVLSITPSTCGDTHTHTRHPGTHTHKTPRHNTHTIKTHAHKTFLCT